LGNPNQRPGPQRHPRRKGLQTMRPARTRRHVRSRPGVSVAAVVHGASPSGTVNCAPTMTRTGPVRPSQAGRRASSGFLIRARGEGRTGR